MSWENKLKFVERESDEFMEGVTGEFNPSELNGLSRRKFLALLSASAAFTATACSDYYDKGEIVRRRVKSEIHQSFGYIQGMNLWYIWPTSFHHEFMHTNPVVWHMISIA